MCLDTRDQTVLDQTKFPCIYPIITLSSPSAISYWYFMLLINQRGVRNVPSKFIQFVVTIFAVMLTSTYIFGFIYI